jgi:TadE-like protein
MGTLVTDSLQVGTTRWNMLSRIHILLSLPTRLKRLATETRGQEIAEAALVLPIAFLILLGIFWFGRAYNVYATVTHAAAEGARVAATPTCATCTNVPQSDVAVFAEITSILQASNLDINQIRAYAPPAYATLPGGCDPLYNNVLICRGILLNNPATAQACTATPTNPPAACGTMVSFKYRFSFPFTTNYQLILIPAAAEARVED